MTERLKDLKIVLTGDFKDYTKKKAVSILKDLGAQVAGSVSGKTSVVIAGKRPGSKLKEGKKRGLPILDETQMRSLIEGKSLEEVINEKVEIVYTPQPKTLPKNGAFKNGLREGSWKKFDSNGKLEEDISWKEGVLDGPELKWENGKKTCEGMNKAGHATGTWTWWSCREQGIETDTNKIIKVCNYDENGKRHGEYSAYQEIGSFFHGMEHGIWTVWGATGAYSHGKKDGKWDWKYWYGNEHEPAPKMATYHGGKREGEAEDWYANGQIASKLSYKNDIKDGVEFTYYEDGSPKTEGEYRRGFEVGVHLKWSKSGKKTETHYRHGFSEKVLTGKKIPVLIEELKSLKGRDWDDYEIEGESRKKISKIAKNEGALLLCLWKEGDYDLPKNRFLWTNLGEENAGLLSGEDLVRFLQGAVTDAFGGFSIEGWNEDLDELAMNVYVRDPDPIDAAWKTLPQHCKDGIALVRARFGKPTEGVLTALIPSLIREGFSFEEQIHWPSGLGDIDRFNSLSYRLTQGEILDQNQPVLVEQLGDPTGTFLRFFGTHEEWGAALDILSKEGDIEASDDLIAFLIKGVPIEGLVQYCNVNPDKKFDNNIETLRQRNDKGEELQTLALAVDETATMLPAIVCAAILKLSEEGNSFSQALLDRLVLASPGVARYDLQGPYAHNVRIGNPRVQDVLGALSKDQRRSIFERLLETGSPSEKAMVAPYLYLIEDPTFWVSAFDILIKLDKKEELVGFGIANIGERIVPTLLKQVKREKNKKLKKQWEEVVIYALFQTTINGDIFDEVHDPCIEFTEENAFMIAYILYRLPSQRAEAILLRHLEYEFTETIFKIATFHPSEILLKKVFEALLVQDEMIDDQGNTFMEGFRNLTNPVDWVNWLFENGASVSDLDVEFHIDRENATTSKDAVDKLLEMEAKKGTPSYALRCLNNVVGQDDLNVIGGAAPGIGLDRWPSFREESMAHLYTLDLATLPELQLRYKDARALSVFCYNPADNEAYETDSGWTCVLFSTQAQIDAGGAVPEGQSVEIKDRFEVVPFTFNVKDQKMKDQVLELSACVLESGIWLQEEEGSGSFVMQFDDTFCGINLGDGGIMYVYDNDAFWQSL